MSNLKPIAILELLSMSLGYETSYSPTLSDAGTHASTMSLYWFDGEKRNGRGCIEWDIPTLDVCENIGIWTEKGALTDYDGVMTLPRPAIKFLRSQGITVGREFVA